jgi:hypothetical protein
VGGQEEYGKDEAGGGAHERASSGRFFEPSRFPQHRKVDNAPGRIEAADSSGVGISQARQQEVNTLAAMPKRKPEPQHEEIVGTTDASHILLVSPETVRIWCEKGLLPFMRATSGARFFKRVDIEKFAAERRKPPRLARPTE